MDLIKKIFPFSFGAKDVTGLIVSIVIHLVGIIVMSLLGGLLGNIPVIGLLLGIVGWVVGLYCTVGIILAVLVFLKVIK